MFRALFLERRGHVRLHVQNITLKTDSDLLKQRKQSEENHIALVLEIVQAVIDSEDPRTERSHIQLSSLQRTKTYFNLVGADGAEGVRKDGCVVTESPAGWL